jgi:plastocyanin
MRGWALALASIAAGLAVACGGNGAAPALTPAPRVSMTPAATAPAPATASPTVPIATPTSEALTPTAAPATPTPPVRQPAGGSAPAATPVPATAAPPAPAPQVVTIVAKNVSFPTNRFDVTAGVVTILFDNQDDGVQHNIVVFDPDGNKVAETEVVAGPAERQVSFTAASPGRYAFKCTLHPLQMTGAFNVQ